MIVKMPEVKKQKTDLITRHESLLNRWLNPYHNDIADGAVISFGQTLMQNGQDRRR
jgi:hypothetical protein